MKTRNKLLLALSSSLLVLSSAAVVTVCKVNDYKKPDVLAYAENDGYTMSFTHSDGLDVSYHYANQEIKKLNYNNEERIFNYKRCRYSNHGLFIMSSGGKFYNPALVGNNGNSLNGMSSITVTFTGGPLYLAIGFGENYQDSDIELTSGTKVDFSVYKPTHFALYTKDAISDEYEVEVSSVSINYHSDSYYDQQEYVFDSVLTDLGSESINSNQTVSHSISNVNIGNKNYIQIEYKSDKKIKGVLTYFNNSTSAVSSEEFFLEEASTTTKFNMFLDNFRKGAAGKFEKTLTGISFKNVGSETATFRLISLGVTNRVYSRSDVITISDSSIELGVSLQFAGSITSVRNLNRNIQEYVDTSENVVIRGSDKHSGDVYNVIANNPNLINIHDVGREIQQAYYMNVDTDQGYTRSTYNGSPCVYDPVQAGSQENNESKIIDYKLTYDSNNAVESIWVKTMALDWAKENSLSHSYMENLYSIEDGLIKVYNRFIDWTGWTNYEDNANFPEGNTNTNGNKFYSVSEKSLFATQELPATYVAHPLNYFSTEFDGKLVFDGNTSWNNTNSDNRPVERSSYLVSNGSYAGETTYQADLSLIKAGNASSANATTYHYEFRKHNENWLGYFNQDKFGLAIYMPANAYNHDTTDRHVFVQGQYNKDHKASNQVNRNYLDSDYNSQTASYKKSSWSWFNKNLEKESCYVDNNNYFATVLGTYPTNYTAVEYSYVIGADYLDTLRSKFNAIQNSGSIYNDFTVWKGACI